ncbi:MAG TPA: tetratricopeptide repeat protein [Aggregatilineales bacterium]|nr:tetratricopeptide repeat protein [Aggregatilineales bacterium]
MSAESRSGPLAKRVALGGCLRRMIGRATPALRCGPIAVRAVILIGAVALLSDPRPVPLLDLIAAGDSALKAGQPAHATSLYQEVLAALPGDSVITDRLATAAEDARRPEVAIALLRRETDRQGWTPDRARHLADLLDQTGATAEAAMYWRISLTGTAADVPTLTRLAAYETRFHDWTAAKNDWRQILHYDPANALAFFGLGLLTLPDLQGLGYLDHLSTNPAYRETVAALKASTTSAEMGLVLIKAGLWPYAEHTLTTALARNPGDSQVMALLGLVQDQEGRDGWPLIDRARRFSPADGLVNFAAASHWQRQGDPARAIDILKRVGTYDPANPTIAAQIGTLYRNQGDTTQAAYWLNVAVALAPDHPEYAGLRVLLATFYADEDYDLTGAGLTTLQTLAAKLPDNAEVHACLGRALAESGQPDAAQAEFTNALALDPTSSRAHYFQGIFLETHGDQAGAIQAYLYIYQHASADEPFRALASRSLVRLGYLLNSPSR